MINNIVNSGFSLFNNVLGDFNKNYMKEAILSIANELHIEKNKQEDIFLTELNIGDTTIKKYIDKNQYPNLLTTNEMIDKFISFKPIIYKVHFTHYKLENDIIFKKLIKIMEIENVYGIVFKYKNRNNFINITHPLVLYNILYSKDNFKNNLDYALIYPIDNNDELIKKELEIYKEYKNNGEFDNLKNVLINFLDKYISKAIIKRISDKKDEKLMEAIIDMTSYNILSYHIDESENIEKHKSHKFIIPCNLICENHFIPQYIWLFLNLDEKGLYGKELFSNTILCTNLSKNSYEKLDKRLDRVCNGGSSIYTKDGLLNMLKQNVNSQYSTLGYKKGFLTFARANVEACIFILNRFLENGVDDVR